MPFAHAGAGVLPASEASATSRASRARSRTNPRKALPVRELTWVAVPLDSYRETIYFSITLPTILLYNTRIVRPEGGSDPKNP